jgi:Phage terminase large subunit
MQSIRESVHQLLEDQISRLGYQRLYEVQKAEIIGRNGTSFTFHCMRDQSVHNIKSLEGADILWVEASPRTFAHLALCAIAIFRGRQRSFCGASVLMVPTRRLWGHHG